MRGYFLELIRRAATELPDDVLEALRRGRDAEGKGTAARSALEVVLDNCRLARDSSRPICQDTGIGVWRICRPPSQSERAIAQEILEATREATRRFFLRPNAVDALSGKNSGDNTGAGVPVIRFHEWGRQALAADLLLRGGGCENVSAQYPLPDDALGAGRDLEGVRRAVIDAVFRAQGQGCAPGVVGVGIGGDRARGMIEAEEQLFRLIPDVNPNPALAKLERRLFAELNALGVGPMGLGGKTTALGVKIGALHRLPASFFVSVAFMCWAVRRASVVISGGRARYSQRAETARGYPRSRISRGAR